MSLPLGPSRRLTDSYVSHTGQIDYRLARNSVVREVRRGRLSRSEVCDAHPELIRAAVNVAEDTEEDCPICESSRLRLVTYAFGSRLPPGGTCVTSRRELVNLARAKRSVSFYVVEVCPSCCWNHLSRSFVLPAKTRTAGP